MNMASIKNLSKHCKVDPTRFLFLHPPYLTSSTYWDFILTKVQGTPCIV